MGGWSEEEEKSRCVGKKEEVERQLNRNEKKRTEKKGRAEGERGNEKY